MLFFKDVAPGSAAMNSQTAAMRGVRRYFQLPVTSRRITLNFMKETEIISWILLATALASQKQSADLKDISMLADGINHAVPTQKELQLSIPWLLKNELIEKEGSKYRLTKKGLINYNFASLKTNALLEIWKNLERQLKNNA
jgi:hypothetical protein